MDFLIVQSKSNGLVILDTSTGKPVQHYKEAHCGLPGLYTGIGYRLGSFCVLSGTNKVLNFYKQHSSTPCQRISAPEPLTALCASLDSTFLVGGSATGAIYIWYLLTGNLLRCWPAHYAQVASLALSDDGAFLVSAGHDGAVNLYLLADVFDITNAVDDDLSSPQAYRNWTAHGLAVSSVDVYGGWVISGSLDRTVHIWSVNSDESLGHHDFSAAITDVKLAATLSQAFVCTNDGKVHHLKLRGTANSSPRKVEIEAVVTQTCHGTSTVACAVNSESNLLATCSADEVKVWDVAGGQCLKTAAFAGAGLNGLKFLSEDRRLPDAWRTWSPQSDSDSADSRPKKSEGLPHLPPLSNVLSPPDNLLTSLTVDDKSDLSSLKRSLDRLRHTIVSSLGTSPYSPSSCLMVTNLFSVGASAGFSIHAPAGRDLTLGLSRLVDLHRLRRPDRELCNLRKALISLTKERDRANETFEALLNGLQSSPGESQTIGLASRRCSQAEESFASLGPSRPVFDMSKLRIPLSSDNAWLADELMRVKSMSDDHGETTWRGEYFDRTDEPKVVPAPPAEVKSVIWNPETEDSAKLPNYTKKRSEDAEDLKIRTTQAAPKESSSPNFLSSNAIKFSTRIGAASRRPLKKRHRPSL